MFSSNFLKFSPDLKCTKTFSFNFSRVTLAFSLIEIDLIASYPAYTASLNYPYFTFSTNDEPFILFTTPFTLSTTRDTKFYILSLTYRSPCSMKFS
jgi:hypothetical protein